MMNKMNLSPFLRLLPLLLICIHHAESKCITDTHRVRIFNQLPTDSDPLRLHCASGDDDLGFHSLPTGKQFEWTFCEDLFGRTLYFCHLWWGLHKQKAFDVYSPNYKSSVVDVDWFAREDGIYYYDNDADGFPFYKKYDWQIS